ncbi:MAG TPA: RNA methyltransferase [Gemmataceae bacterium]|nr:RNA methyltransferase [Gemmataceae bacterium]
MSLHRARVVLVRTQIAENLGAAARVMRNLGLNDLVLVSPEANPADRQARRLSTHGEAVLDQARIVPDLSEAVADCVLVAGTSARTGQLIRGQFDRPDTIMPRLIESMGAGPVALVFGPERNGLTDHELTRCHHRIHIPTDPAYPALNLAQAVAICGYELRRAWLTQTQPAEETAPPATFAAMDRMFADLRASLEAIHFLYGPKADSLMHALRHLISRARPTEMEVGMLFGLARQIRWFVEQQMR